MNILIACEESGRVRDEFIRRGHNAISCDLLPSATPGPHYQGYLEDIIGSGREWDMIIAFPPCTYLTGAAEWAFNDVPMIKGKPRNIKPGTLIGAERREAREYALAFVQMILNRDCEKIVLENPVGIIGTRIRPADQWIQPNEYGDDASKKTGLWLKGVPKLQPTKHIAPRIVEWPHGSGKLVKRWANQTDSGQNILGPSPDRALLRGKTYPGIARALAEQLG